MRKGDNLAHPAKLAPRKSLLSGSTDWKLRVDYSDRPIVFPPEILATNQRPDIVSGSVARKKVIMVELTCPAEEGIEAAVERKLGRYTQLKQDIEEVGWMAGLLTIELGACGYVAYCTERCFRQLGMQKRKVSSLCKSLSRWWLGARMRSTYLGRTRTGTGNGNCLQKQMCPATRSRILQPSSHTHLHKHRRAS